MKRSSIVAAAFAVMIGGAALSAVGGTASAMPFSAPKPETSQASEANPLFQEVARKARKRWYGKNWRYNRRWHGPRYRYRHGGYRHYNRGYWYKNRYWDNDDDFNIYLGVPFIAAPFAYGGYDGGYNDGYGSRHVRWCLNRYNSYNPRTNRFLGYDGYYHRCNSPYS